MLSRTIRRVSAGIGSIPTSTGSLPNATRRPSAAPHTATGKGEVVEWTLWRCDTHGNTLDIGRFATHEACELARAELDAVPHKQHYWCDTTVADGGEDRSTMK